MVIPLCLLLLICLFASCGYGCYRCWQVEFAEDERWRGQRVREGLGQVQVVQEPRHNYERRASVKGNLAQQPQQQYIRADEVVRANNHHPQRQQQLIRANDRHPQRQQHVCVPGVARANYCDVARQQQHIRVPGTARVNQEVMRKQLTQAAAQARAIQLVAHRQQQMKAAPHEYVRSPLTLIEEQCAEIRRAMHVVPQTKNPRIQPHLGSILPKAQCAPPFTSEPPAYTSEPPAYTSSRQHPASPLAMHQYENGQWHKMNPRHSPALAY